MPAIFDLLYREYCRARLAEMRKQLLISPERHEVPEAICDAKDAVGTSPASHVSGGVRFAGGASYDPRNGETHTPVAQDPPACDRRITSDNPGLDDPSPPLLLHPISSGR